MSYDRLNPYEKAAFFEGLRAYRRHPGFSEATRVLEPYYGPPTRELQVKPAIFTHENTLKLHEVADWQNCDYNLGRFAGHAYKSLKRFSVPLVAFRAYTPASKLKQGCHEAHMSGHAVSFIHAIHGPYLKPQELDWIRLQLASSIRAITEGTDLGISHVPTSDPLTYVLSDESKGPLWPLPASKPLRRPLGFWARKV